MSYLASDLRKLGNGNRNFKTGLVPRLNKQIYFFPTFCLILLICYYILPKVVEDFDLYFHFELYDVHRNLKNRNSNKQRCVALWNRLENDSFLGLYAHD